MGFALPGNGMGKDLNASWFEHPPWFLRSFLLWRGSFQRTFSRRRVEPNTFVGGPFDPGPLLLPLMSSNGASSGVCLFVHRGNLRASLEGVLVGGFRFFVSFLYGSTLQAPPALKWCDAVDGQLDLPWLEHSPGVRACKFKVLCESAIDVAFTSTSEVEGSSARLSRSKARTSKHGLGRSKARTSKHGLSASSTDSCNS